MNYFDSVRGRPLPSVTISGKVCQGLAETLARKSPGDNLRVLIEK